MCIIMNFFIFLVFLCSPLFSMELKRPFVAQGVEEEQDSGQRKFMAVHLDRTFFTDAENRQTELENTTTGATPEKARMFSVRTPVNNQVANLFLGDISTITKSLMTDFNMAESKDLREFSKFHSEQTQYMMGKWAHVEAWHPKRSIGIDADHQSWPLLIESLAEDINFNSEEYFLATTILAIKDHYRQLSSTMYYRTKYPVECRHYTSVDYFLQM